MSDASATLQIIGQDQASAEIKQVTRSVADLEKEARKLGETIRKAFEGVSKPFEDLDRMAQEFGSKMAEGADKARQAMQGDISTARDLQQALQQVAEAQSRIAAGARSGVVGSGSTAGIRTAAREQDTIVRRQARMQADIARGVEAGRAKAHQDWMRGLRARVAVMRDQYRQDDEAARQQAAQRAAIDRGVARGQQRAHDQWMAGVKARFGVMSHEWRAEDARHITRLRHQRELRANIVRSGREAVGHAGHAVRSMSHPFYGSPAMAAEIGIAIAGEATRRILEETANIDTAAARYKMFALQPGANADQETAKARKQALLDSINLGLDADQVLDIQTKAIRDGIAPEIAKTLPKSLAAAAQVMGGDVEKLTDALAEGVQQATSMGWVKNAEDTRRLLNIQAGLSNFSGNSAKKTEDFIRSGGLGFGKEIGYSELDTLAMSGILNSSGEGSGRSSARFLGQLSQNVPKMFDKYQAARDSHKNTEEARAVRSAPYQLGYGSIQDMQRQIMAGPEGLIDFAKRLEERLDDKTRKLVLEGYGFSQQGGAALAEIGANSNKAKSIIARTKELAQQKSDNDYLTEKFRSWQSSLVYMIRQIEAGWHAIESELGDVLKNDIIGPLRDWWVMLSTQIINSPLKDNLHKAIAAFIEGLGFRDMKDLLGSITSNVNSDSIVGFAKGLGEGIKTIKDSISGLFNVVSGIIGGGDAETMGKLTSELFGLALAAHAVGPIVGIIGSLSAAFLALKATIETGVWIANITGLASAIKALAGLDLAAGASGLMSLAGAIGVMIGLAGEAAAKGILAPPKDFSWQSFLRFLDPGLADRVYGPEQPAKQPAPAPAAPSAPVPTAKPGAPAPDMRDPIQYRRNLWHRSSYIGDDWRGLIQPAAYSDGAIGTSSAVLSRLSDIRDAIRHQASQPSTDGDFRSLIQKASFTTQDGKEERVKNAIIGTEQGIKDIKDQMQRTASLMQLASLQAATLASGGVDGGGGGEGSGDGYGAPSLRYGRSAGGGYQRHFTGSGGVRSLRYGRGSDGQYRHVPGSGNYGNPSKSLLDLIAKAEGGGYNLSWGNGRFMPGGHDPQLTGKSLNEILQLGNYMRQQPGSLNSSAMGRYQMTGAKIRDLMRRMHLSGNEKFDERMQDAMASRLLHDEGPRALQRWKGLKRGDRMAQAMQLLRSGQIASQPGSDDSGGAGGAVSGTGPLTRKQQAPDDSAAGAGGAGRRGLDVGGDGSQIAQRLQAMKKAGLVTNDQCVELAKAAVGLSGVSHVRDWRKGIDAAAGTLKPGTPIATFLNRRGEETDRYAGGGVGTPGAHLDHAGVFESYIRDKAGSIVGMRIAEQYARSHGVRERNYMFGQGWGEGNGSNYHAILGPDGGYLGGARNPMSHPAVDAIKQSDDAISAAGQAAKQSVGGTAEHMGSFHRQADDIAKGVPKAPEDKAKGVAPDGRYGRPGGMYSADAGGGDTHIHVHRTSEDPNHIASLVSKVIREQQNYRRHDVDAFA